MPSEIYVVACARPTNSGVLNAKMLHDLKLNAAQILASDYSEWGAGAVGFRLLRHLNLSFLEFEFMVYLHWALGTVGVQKVSCG